MAAGSTYTPIATTTLGSATSSFTFSSISGSYTDLVLVATMQRTGSPANCLVRVNGDSGSNYSNTFLYGDGSAAGSGRSSNQTQMQMDSRSFPPASGFNNMIANFQNYSNATTYKTVISRSNEASGGAEAFVNLWRNTAAITSIEIRIGSGNFATGSTFTLYGIAAA